MTLNYQQKTYNECIYFEENITCLDLMDKYFPTLNCIIQIRVYRCIVKLLLTQVNLSVDLYKH